MNNIDIIEEMLKNTKTNKRGNKEIKFEVNSNYYTAISNLIAENKELKERNKRQQENLKITNKKIAAQRGQLMMLNKAYIPKSKVKEAIEEVKEDENPSILSFQEYAQEYAIDKLQSLLGKE